MSLAGVQAASERLTRTLGAAGVSSDVVVTCSARGGIRVNRDPACDDETWEAIAATVAETVTDPFELRLLDGFVHVGGHIEGVPVITGVVAVVLV
jgi:hypothetical protein